MWGGGGVAWGGVRLIMCIAFQAIFSKQHTYQDDFGYAVKIKIL